MNRGGRSSLTERECRGILLLITTKYSHSHVRVLPDEKKKNNASRGGKKVGAACYSRKTPCDKKKGFGSESRADHENFFEV